MTQIESFTQSPRPALFLALLLTATFGAACSGSNRNSASSSPLSGEAFEGEITSRTFFGSQPTEIRYAIKGTRARVETASSQDSAETSAILMDFSSNTATTLFPQVKAYTTTNLAELVQDLAEVAWEVSSIDFSKATSTGETETISGATCQHWLIGDTTDMCLAPGLANFRGGVLDKLKNFALPEEAKAQLDANPEFSKFAEGGVFILKMATIENGQPKTIMEVTNIERKSLDDAIFEAPAGYKKTELQ